ncbi:hypothetical protein [Bradyrhizobium sp. AZCC 2289]|uniref:hypothetical protein n=1 Tax=Bradyrhizobium sp. AZCC 2289 TaxID=3117026 RepID=UPI002FEF3E6B
MQEVQAFYANNEDRLPKEQAEPSGNIPTEVGMKARQHRTAFQRRADAGRN